VESGIYSHTLPGEELINISSTENAAEEDLKNLNDKCVVF